ncbi:two-component regulator propeller domain-containing protein [Pedobacter sp. B4-66]|uniref:ligand-binding sensor domain-containing protein n=1 Tax=Pedobacter sp. B4-66 TaxID=2817280 RepID=UPI001BDB68AB|nr:two-component regulator propeller domain-containing protein [Pedobacter sp. B4-66]
MKWLLSSILILSLLLSGCKKKSLVADPDVVDDGGFETPKGWGVYNTSNSKIADNQINALSIDNDNVKWVGTAKGLTRMEGSNWMVFDIQNSPLPSSYITSVLTENNGVVWIGTDKGLAKYHDQKWTVYKKDNSSLPDERISCMTYDSVRKITWIATANGLVSIDEQNNWRAYDELGDEAIYDMEVDRNGTLWLGTFNHFAFKGRIRKFDGNGWTTFKLDELGYRSAFPYSLAIDKQNQVLVALTGTAEKSVIRFNSTIWYEVAGPEMARGLNVIAIDNDRIWVGGFDLYQFGDKNGAVLSSPDTDSPIKCMAIDRKGSKWLGTIYGGLVVYRD